MVSTVALGRGKGQGTLKYSAPWKSLGGDQERVLLRGVVARELRFGVASATIERSRQHRGFDFR